MEGRAREREKEDEDEMEGRSSWPSALGEEGAFPSPPSSPSSVTRTEADGAYDGRGSSGGGMWKRSGVVDKGGGGLECKGEGGEERWTSCCCSDCRVGWRRRWEEGREGLGSVDRAEDGDGGDDQSSEADSVSRLTPNLTPPLPSLPAALNVEVEDEVEEDG